MKFLSSIQHHQETSGRGRVFEKTIVLILVNSNLVQSPCPVCNQIYHQEPATTFLACLFRDPSAAAGGKTGSVGKAVYTTAQLYIFFYNADTVVDL